MFGGDMDNPVVTAVTSELAGRGWATLRFNFRGVGSSSGAVDDVAGHVSDAAAAVDYLVEESGAGNVIAGGYSYGAHIAIESLLGRSDIAGLLAVSPPFAMLGSALSASDKPVSLLVGDRDEYCTLADFQGALQSLGPAARGEVVHGADHFWFGHDAKLASFAASFAAGFER